jgi:hypothetical protein
MALTKLWVCWHQHVLYSENKLRVLYMTHLYTIDIRQLMAVRGCKYHIARAFAVNLILAYSIELQFGMYHSS